MINFSQMVLRNVEIASKHVLGQLDATNLKTRSICRVIMKKTDAFIQPEIVLPYALMFSVFHLFSKFD